MATSTNYGWAEPDNSSLVKNGAQDMRTLGNAIDTSLWNSGFGQTGKNKIINGNFGIWQRGTSGFSLGAAYNADRFLFYRDGSGATEAVTQQTFTPGTAPVAGYESQYYWRYSATVAGTGGTERSLYSRIEDVRTFAAQTVTFSFWAKADAARTITVSAKQVFGSGGSADVTTAMTSQSVTTSWARYSATVSIPSVSGKTIGTSSYLQFTLGFPVNVVETIDIWGWQAEYGSVATPFQLAGGGAQQAELALCQRYYYSIGTGIGRALLNVSAFNVTSVYGVYRFPVTMRTAPTLEQVTGTNYFNLLGNGVTDAFDSISAITDAYPNGCRLDVTSGIATIQGLSYWLTFNNAATNVAFSAEL